MRVVCAGPTNDRSNTTRGVDMHRIVRWALGLALFASVSSLAHAQSQALNGLIEGTVKDTSGGVMPGAYVTVVNTTNGESETFVTDGNGSYRAPLLSLGVYSVRITLPGFRTFVREGF